MGAHARRGAAPHQTALRVHPQALCGSPRSRADEPERIEDLRQVIDWIGWDRLLFATDYPHWDMDNPELAFKCR